MGVVDTCCGRHRVSYRSAFRCCFHLPEACLLSGCGSLAGCRKQSQCLDPLRAADNAPNIRIIDAQNLAIFWLELMFTLWNRSAIL